MKIHRELESICEWLSIRLNLGFDDEKLWKMKISEIPKLDSITFVSLVIQLENIIGISFTLEEIVAIRDLSLLQVVSKYKNDSN